jgi:hypothetical protein
MRPLCVYTAYKASLVVGPGGRVDLIKPQNLANGVIKERVRKNRKGEPRAQISSRPDFAGDRICLIMRVNWSKGRSCAYEA